MNNKAQAGLEYLMTYGWALVFVATSIGVLVFVVSDAGTDVDFTSTAPTKLMLKGGVQDTTGVAEIVAQNITGGAIEVTSVYLSGDYAGATTLNGTSISKITSANPMSITGGGVLTFEGIQYVGSGTVEGAVNVTYKDIMGFTNTEKLSAKGSSPATATLISVCGQTLSVAGNYVLGGDISTASGKCIAIAADNISLNCEGRSITGGGMEDSSNVGVYVDQGVDNASIKNCTITDNQYGFKVWGYPTEIYDLQVTGNTITGNRYGYYAFHSYRAAVAENTANENYYYGC